MGGCRCSYYKCSNNTTHAKETNSIHSHFFHFPIRDLQRCKSWAVYSNNMSFLTLPMDKLKNKVICDMHFPESSFMNYTRSKLNKTTAIPTIFINEHNQEVDLLSSPTDWVIANRSASIPSHFKDSNTTKIDIDDSNAEIVDVPMPKKIKIETLPPKVGEVRILNKMMTPQSNKMVTVKQISNKNEQVTPKSLPTTAVKNQKNTVKLESLVNYQAKHVEKPKVFKEVTPAQVSFNESDQQQETYEFVTVLSDEQPSFVNETSTQVSNDEIKSILSQTSQDISEIKAMLSTNISKSQTPIKNENSNISQSQFNKVQLFNGIKRYLSPSLIALLRMELFGSANRDYKKDEKIICTELLKLGDETYDFFNDEWRLRLPSKDQVKSWQNEELTDDDAC